MLHIDLGVNSSMKVVFGGWEDVKLIPCWAEDDKFLQCWNVLDVAETLSKNHGVSNILTKCMVRILVLYVISTNLGRNLAVKFRNILFALFKSTLRLLSTTQIEHGTRICK
jgi:hypothetical protein